MGNGKKKIEIKKIEKQSSRMTTFSKRRKGLFKKADEFRAKTGGKIAVLVISPSGKPYPHGDIEDLSAALSSSSNVQNSTMNSGYIPNYDDEVFIGGNGQDLKRWLNDIRVERYDLDKLLRLKKQLLDIKDRIISAEVESWTLY